MASMKGQRPVLISEVYADELSRRPKSTTGWLILAIITVVLAIFFTWLIISLLRDANDTNVIQRCDPGLCKFSTITGIKTCPDVGDTQGIQLDVGLEFCTSEDYCQERNYTCALQLDQSVDCDGVCGPGNGRCRCIANSAV